MKRIVYVLGAGFSAPLRIPTIAGFLQRAKDLLQDRPAEFGYFQRIFDSIRTLQVANNYYATNIDSIEDLLTLLDFKNTIAGTEQATSELLDLVKKFINDVITNSMAKMELDKAPQRWDTMLFWDRPWTDYGPFVAALLGYEFARVDNPTGQTPQRSDYKCAVADDPSTSYSVISLNYDLVLEEAAKSINHLHKQRRVFAQQPRDPKGTPLLKLHGSIGTGPLVPPLWNKSLPPGIREAWDAAFELLKDANEIRILGYSLPETDSYIRYLFRAAAEETTNLQRIHILCLDEDGTVQDRYSKFIKFNGYRRADKESFNNGRIEAYLASLQSHTQQWPVRISPQETLELVHGQVFV